MFQVLLSFPLVNIESYLIIRQERLHKSLCVSPAVPFCVFLTDKLPPSNFAICVRIAVTWHRCVTMLLVTFFNPLQSMLSLTLHLIFAAVCSFSKLLPRKIHSRAPCRQIHSVENILSSTGIEGPFEEYNKFVKITCL